MDTNNLPQWKLDDLYTSLGDPQIQKDISWCQDQSDIFVKKYKDAFSSHNWTGQVLYGAIKHLEEIQEKMTKLISYAGLLYYKHLNDQNILSFYQQTQEILTTIGNKLIFFTLNLNKIDESKINEALDECATLRHYQPWINQIQLYKNHQLSSDIEKLLAEKSLTSSSAWIRLYDETLASIQFEFRNETHTLASITNLTYHNDETIRLDASISLHKGLESKANLLTIITNTLAKDKSIEDQWRCYDTPMNERHLSNQVEPEVVESLVNTVEKNYPEISHHYYALKAKIMGKDKLEYWDRNAPLPFVNSKEIEWNEAKDIVLKAYHDFSPKIANIAERFFSHNWIDAPALDHKTSGAFSHPTIPSAHPYILLNYLGKHRDIMTLAHELGHGVHQVLAAKQGLFIANTPLTLAETASVFGEMLTFKSLIHSCDDENQKIQLLASKIEDMINTVVRQIAFYQFEVEIHKQRKIGELTKETINDIWVKTQEKALGPSVHIDPVASNYWGYISHFIHSPFYVYAYAFGDCLVNSLYAVYEQDSHDFVSKYLSLLESGGSKRHQELLAPFNLDASQPDFWEKGLNMIKNLICDLDTLVHG